MSIKVVWACEQCEAVEVQLLPLGAIGEALWPKSAMQTWKGQLLCEACHATVLRDWLAKNPGVVLVA